MKTSNKFKPLALAIGMIAAPGAQAVDLADVRMGVGLSPSSTFSYSTDYQATDAQAALPSITVAYRIPGPTPLFIRAEYINEKPLDAESGYTHVLGLAMEYQFREKLDGFRPYVFGGAATMFSKDDGEPVSIQTVGRVGVGVRHSITKGFEADANYSAFFGQDRVSFMTIGINYRFN